MRVRWVDTVWDGCSGTASYFCECVTVSDTCFICGDFQQRSTNKEISSEIEYVTVYSTLAMDAVLIFYLHMYIHELWDRKTKKTVVITLI